MYIVVYCSFINSKIGKSSKDLLDLDEFFEHNEGDNFQFPLRFTPRYGY